MGKPKQPFHKICVACGKEFETYSNRAVYCKGPHVKMCEVCGKIFEYQPASHNEVKVCSEECRKKAISISSKGRPFVKILYHLTCSECGQPFDSYAHNAKICDRLHLRVCKQCGNTFEVTKSQILNNIEYCSLSCSSKHNMTELYSDTFRRDKFIADVKSTMIKNYGVDHPSRSKYIMEKRKHTTNLKYGVDHVLQSQSVREKSKEVWLSKYGVDNPSKSPNIVAKIVSRSHKELSIQDWQEFYVDPKSYVIEHFDEMPSLHQLAQRIGIADSSVGWIINSRYSKDERDSFIKYHYSVMEDEVYDYIHEMLPEVKIIRQSFDVISPYQIDIYLPDLRFGIECNPTYTHNSSFTCFSDTNVKMSPGYHKMKTDMCDSKNIFLFHLFGYEWSNKQDILKSMICNILGRNRYKIYGRCTSVVKVSYKDSNEFLELNHRQGKAPSKVRLGLIYKGELQSLMTFGKMRKTIGDNDVDDLTDCWELVRFCNKLQTSVIGGASKLFKYFVSEYHPKRVRSFSDRCHTKGNLYETLGFKYVHTSDPGYVWVDMSTDVAYNRVNAQKRNIARFLQDPEIDLSQTESQLMESHGFAKVYDSGVKLWEWRTS